VIVACLLGMTALAMAAEVKILFGFVIMLQTLCRCAGYHAMLGSHSRHCVTQTNWNVTSACVPSGCLRQLWLRQLRLRQVWL
jgi:hypothetical protein